MTQTEFDKLVKQLNDYSFDIMVSKRPEYTNEDTDVLANFKSTAERLETSEMKVWATFFEKQIQSIYAHLKNANLKKSEPIHSRFADVINYCYLGYALFVERDGKKRLIKFIAIVLIAVLSIFYVKHKQKKGTRLRETNTQRI